MSAKLKLPARAIAADKARAATRRDWPEARGLSPCYFIRTCDYLEMFAVDVWKGVAERVGTASGSRRIFVHAAGTSRKVNHTSTRLSFRHHPGNITCSYQHLLHQALRASLGLLLGRCLTACRGQPHEDLEAVVDHPVPRISICPSNGTTQLWSLTIAIQSMSRS